MIDTILAYAGASYPVLLLASAGYMFFRELGAAAGAAIGQFLANLGSSPWGAATIHSQPSCLDVLQVGAALPLVLFALVPAVRLEISYRRREASGASDFLSFWTLFFLASAANHAVNALFGIPYASPAAGGALWLALLSGSAAFVVSTPDIAPAAELVQSERTTAVLPPLLQEAPAVTKPRLVPIPQSDEPAESKQPLSASAREAEVLPFVPRRMAERGSQAMSTSYLFNNNEFFIFRHEHIQVLEDLLRREPPGVLEGLQSAICARLGRRMIAGDERAFVQSYVSQFRRRLEACYPAYASHPEPERLAA